MTLQARILDTILPFQAATVITASSSNTEFPVSNLTHPFRSKVWRSTGNFVIDSTNNKINFKESGGGSELTATLASGTYTSTSLASEIKTKMQAAVGATGTYTVTNSATTGKWTISTSLGFLSILWATGTNAANSTRTAIGFNNADSTGATSYTGQNVAIHTEESIVFDLGSALAVDSVAVLFDSLPGVKLSGSVALTIQANATNAWSSPSVSQALTIDTTQEVATHFFSSDQSYRFWRLKIVDPTNTFLYVEIGKVLLAKATQLSQTPDIGFKFTLNDQSKITKTAYGHQYADVYPIKKAFEFDYSALTHTDFVSLAELYRVKGNTEVIAFSLDPTEELFDKDRFFIYGYMQGDFKAEHKFLNYFNDSLSIEEAV